MGLYSLVDATEQVISKVPGHSFYYALDHSAIGAGLGSHGPISMLAWEDTTEQVISKVPGHSFYYALDHSAIGSGLGSHGPISMLAWEAATV